ncbi:MAG: DUF6320 domain-containing protein [Christensenellales bacterium]
MSYCVHCGVALAASEKDCPLCGTLVQNPVCAWQKPEEMPYPETIEIQKAHIDRRYARQLVAMILAVPAVIVLLIDLVDGGGVGWSLIVSASLCLAYCWIIVPLLFKFSKPYAYILIDVLSLCGFLLLVALLTQGLSWYIGLVLPLLLWLGLVVTAALLAIRRLEMVLLYRAALLSLLLGIFLLGLECLLRRHAGLPLGFQWSFFAAIPSGVIALMLVLLQRNEPLKREIRKHLFI